ncbi:trypsin-like serine peptidase [Nevskia soli]|uniref:trypsin-like serine peptidase n=1 Tax=Nevskia soli TaxID=418856 RepID=UPI0004A77EF9|nr:hypothetical protein [Nevskia soli]
MAMMGRILLLSGLLVLGQAHAATQPQANLHALDAVPRFALDGAAVAKVVATAEQGKSRPLQFAVTMDLPLTLSDGRWETLDADTSSWRLRVGSAGAQSLGFEFSRFRMPAGGELLIYDARGQLMQGPYTATSETPEGRLWTAIVPGAEAVIEARVPTAARDALQLELARVGHGFRDFSAAAAGIAEPRAIPGGGAAASCEVNIACPAGNDWGNEARAVATYTVGNQFICTGQLVNDVPGDNTPFFLTANHCEVGQTLTTPASSVVVYWNYQASGCSGGAGPLNHTQSGAKLIAGDSGADFTLIQLNQTPDPSYNVWYAGWDVTGTPATSGADIHQPGGDVKKISLFSRPTSKVTVQLQNTLRTVQAWDVVWSLGITEDGSSGSGLYNSNHHLIGVLSGGSSSCASPGGDDVFGRLDVAWTAQALASGQLKAHLDPNNTGAKCVAGRNPGDSPASTDCSVVGGSAATQGTGGESGGGSGGAWPISLSLLLAPLAALRSRRRKKA